ncbi:unnamed protein product [Protopolystoma xenopodis]|uniref:Uncharacterized protein n=1 Tax=Protopolystoma xenopodis TaxID=117903 RepID=A0A3S5ABI5_9PLAT|nr:unnamed protein product [Protopolystoma xenopodis]
MVALLTAGVSIQLLRLGFVVHTMDGQTMRRQESDSLLMIALTVAAAECLVSLVGSLASCQLAKLAKIDLQRKREGLFHVIIFDDKDVVVVTNDANKVVKGVSSNAAGSGGVGQQRLDGNATNASSQFTELSGVHDGNGAPGSQLFPRFCGGGREGGGGGAAAKSGQRDANLRLLEWSGPLESISQTTNLTAVRLSPKRPLDRGLSEKGIMAADLIGASNGCGGNKVVNGPRLVGGTVSSSTPANTGAGRLLTFSKDMKKSNRLILT